MVSKVEEIGGIPFVKANCNVRIPAKGRPEWKRMFGHRIASKKRHNQNLEILCRLVI
jgi:hypothetical protein